MQCTCGDEVNLSTHVVTTQKGVDKWTTNLVKPPLEIQQWKCRGCGRLGFKAYQDDELVDSRGI